MSDAWLLALMLAGVIVLTPVAEVVRVPQPVLLTIFGLVVGAMPFASSLDIEPTLVLPTVLPPLLFAATQRTTVAAFREQAGAVLGLAVGLTVCSAAVVAVIAHQLGLAWAPAWVLGAVVSPPDPVAATAVARRLRLPHRLVTILEGEGMFNDATALVLYKVAVAAVVTGAFSWAQLGLRFALAIVVGPAVGLVVGFLVMRLLVVVGDAYTETTITVVAPFVAYLGAERAEGSGVLAVLVLGLHLRSAAHGALTSRGWLLGRWVWSYADFLITSLAFAVLGLQLTTVLGDVPSSATVLRVSIATVLATVLFRIVWVFPVSWLSRLRARARDAPLPTGWRETLVVSWSGMRGVVTVATVLALPRALDSGAEFTERRTLVVAALSCVLVTLVVQGLTLAPLTSRLGVAGSPEEDVEVAELRQRAAGAALDYVRRQLEETPVSEQVRRALLLRYEGYLEAHEAMQEVRLLETEDGDPAGDLDRLLTRATDIERSLVLDERRRGRVTPAAADAVLHDIEGRALRDLD